MNRERILYERLFILARRVYWGSLFLRLLAAAH